MVFDDFKVRILNGLFQLAGTFVSQTFTPDTLGKEEELMTHYYDKAYDISKRRVQRNEMTPEQRNQEDEQLAKDLLVGTMDQRMTLASQPQIPLQQQAPSFTKDLSAKRIEEGVACLQCSRDHLSTASAMLNEAIRFTKNRPMYDEEIQWRIGVALDEVNAMERGDLHNDNVQNLQGKEREIAEEALGNLRDLRHKITAIQSSDDLKQTASYASKVKTNFMRKIFMLSQADGTIDKLCVGMDGEEKQKCIGRVNEILDKKIATK